MMRRAVAGEVVWYAFLAKMIFTAVTLGGGFKGGEIVRRSLSAQPSAVSSGICWAFRRHSVRR